MNKVMVVALYLRLSVEDYVARIGEQDESNSITAQRNILRDFVAGREEFEGCEIIELCDDGYSGTNLHRPQIQKLLEMAKAKTVDCIIVKDFSRFGRDYLTVSDYVDQIFPFLGIRFISINDGYDSADYNDMTSGVDMAFRNVVYAYYSRDISEKVRSGKRVRAEKGKYLSPFAPIGYRKDEKDKNHLVIDEVSAVIVRRIFRLAGMGMSVMQITKLLNAEKVPTPSALKNQQGLKHKWWDGISGKKQWFEDVIVRILRDERYLGKNIYGRRYRPEVGNRRTKKSGKDNWIIVEDCHEPLVTPEEFQAAKDMLKEYVEKDTPALQPHLFKGKLRCGVCHYALERKKSPTPRYSCVTRYRTSGLDCMKGHIKEEDLAEVVFQAILLYCQTLLEKQRRVKKASRGESIPNLQKQVEEYQSAVQGYKERKALLYDSKLDCIITKEQYIAKRDELSAQQEDLEKKIEELSAKIELLKQQQNGAAPQTQVFETYLSSDHLTREMVEVFVDCIYVHSDSSIHIDWLFDEKGLRNEQK